MPKKRKTESSTQVTTVTTTKKTTGKKPRKKKTARKTTSSITKTKTSHKKEYRLDDKLLENLVSLQKVHTNLAEKFDKLAGEISHLLALFELAAKNFSKHPATKITESDKAFLDKIDRLLEQNKTIAKGLTLMEDQMRKKIYQEPRNEEPEIPKPSGSELGSIETPTPSAPPGYTASMKTNRPLPRF